MSQGVVLTPLPGPARLPLRDVAVRIYFSQSSLYVYFVVLFLNVLLLAGILQLLPTWFIGKPGSWHLQLLEALLTLLLICEVALRALVIGSFGRYIKSRENLLDLLICLLCTLFLL